MRLPSAGRGDSGSWKTFRSGPVGSSEHRRSACGRNKSSAFQTTRTVTRRASEYARARPADGRERNLNDSDVLSGKQAELCERSQTDYSDLRALFINCTLKRSPERSHTQGLMDISMEIMRRNGVAVECIRAVDREIATGVWPDMTEHGWEKDEWAQMFETVMASDILVLGTAIWLGEKSSVCTQVIERLYGNSHLLNDAGVKHCALEVLYSLQHLGYTIPPQADAGWIGEAGPGPSYLDEGSGGPENDFTNRNTTFMTWNLLHLARILKDAGGIPAHGNQRSEWDAGNRLDYPNPDYR